MKCVPFRFQKGDRVFTPKGEGVVTAVGMQAVVSLEGAIDFAEFVAVTYRVGRNQYWYEWQLAPITAKQVKFNTKKPSVPSSPEEE